MDWNKILKYDTETGTLMWRVKLHGPTTAIGKEVGSIKSDGRYRSFVYSHRRYYTHRVIWEMHYGQIQDGMCIDHIDGNGLNNKLQNLRLTTLSGNQRNRRRDKRSTTGITGVVEHKGRFAVHCAGKYVGYFKDIELAAKARKTAESENGFHENHGRS